MCHRRRYTLFIAFLVATSTPKLPAQVPPLLDLRDLTPSQGVRVLGEVTGSFIFREVVTGDLNGDGKLDVIVSAPWSVFDESMPEPVYVIWGGAPALQSGLIDLSALDVNNGCRIVGPRPGNEFGSNIASGFDFNHDGIDDLAVSAPIASPDGRFLAGQVFVIFGHPQLGQSGSFDVASLDGTNGFVINGRDPFDAIGENGGDHGDLPVVDFNNDGYIDIVLRSSTADAPGRPGAGQTYIVFGGPSVGSNGVFEIGSLSSQNGITVNGRAVGSGIGRIGSPGDVNGDLIPDISWGGASGPPDRPSAGNTVVLFGGSVGDANGMIDINDIPGNSGIVIWGPDADARAYFPTKPIGDINQDGVNDILINAGAGTRAFVVFGGSYLNNITEFDLLTIDGTNGFTLSPCCRYYQSAGDFDGDGRIDLQRQD